MTDQTETVEMVYIVPPGRSHIMRLEATGARVNVSAKTIVRPGVFKGVDQKEMDAMVERGELKKVANTSDIDEMPNANLDSRTEAADTGGPNRAVEGDKVGVSEPRKPDPPAAPAGAGKPRNFDPAVLRQQVADQQINLDQLNDLVRERDASMAPFDDTDAAINWLSVEHDSRPPAPPPAPPAAPGS